MRTPFRTVVAIALLGLPHVGCERREEFSASFQPRELTAIELARRDAVFANLIGESKHNLGDLDAALTGKTVDECKELLSLADQFSVYGQYLSYEYTIQLYERELGKEPQEGDGYLEIGVENGVVIGVAYSELCL